MKVTKGQFKEFLTELGFKQGIGFEDDVMYSDLFGSMWVYFTGDKKETMNETYCSMNITNKEEIDLARFVLDALKAQEIQDVTYAENYVD